MRRCISSNVVHLIAAAGLLCSLARPQDDNRFAVFRSQTNGFAVHYPRSWYSQIASDIFSIENYPAAKAVQAVRLPKGGAGIKVVTASQAITAAQKLPMTLDGLVAEDNAHQRVVSRRTVTLDDGQKRLSLIEVKTMCCDGQEAIGWYFEIEGRMFIGRLYYWRGDPNRDTFRQTFKDVILSLRLLPESNAVEITDISRWKSLTNRAGWTMKYPPAWRVDTCRQCPDPTDPDVLVAFQSPSTEELVTIEHLIDRPSGRSEEQWLDEIKRTTNLSPRVSEEWITIAGVRALKVTTGNAGLTENEDIYLLHRSKTFAIRASMKKSSYPLYHTMLSTFKFSSD